MKLDGFEGRVALVTGAAQGIGKQICLTLAEQGCRVVGVDVQPVEVDAVEPVSLDVTDERAVAAAVEKVEARVGPIDILVLNAGVLSKASLADTTTSEWERQLAVNLTGPFFLARAIVPGMPDAASVGWCSSARARGSRGPGPRPCAGGLCRVEGGGDGADKSIAGEYAGAGVTANALAPTLIDTGMLGPSTPTTGRRYPSAGTERRARSPRWWCSCAGLAGYITGEVVDINGGFLID